MKTLIIVNQKQYNSLLQRINIEPLKRFRCNHNYGFFEDKRCLSPVKAIVFYDANDKAHGQFYLVTAALLCEHHLIELLQNSNKYELRGSIPADVIRKMNLMELEKQQSGNIVLLDGAV